MSLSRTSSSGEDEDCFRSNASADDKDLEGAIGTGCLSIIVLDASGDLAKKKTFPALFHLFQQGFLQSNEVHIFGYARTKISSDDLRDRLRGYLIKGARASVEQDEVLSRFLHLIKYVSGSYDSEEGFLLLDKEISEHESRKNCDAGKSRRLFYLALHLFILMFVE